MVPRMWCSLRVIVVLGGYCTAAQSCYVEPLHYRGADTSISWPIIRASTT